MDPLSLRSKNPLLPALQAAAPESQAYATELIEVLPLLSVSLLDFARYFGGAMVARYNKRTSDMHAQYLVLCVHDVQLKHVFARVVAATQDQALAANYVAALVYQAIGKTPRCDDQTIFLGLSYQLRGLDKYAALARMNPGISDPVAATFAKEFGHLVFGRTTEDVIVLGASKTLEIGLYTDANIRGILLREAFSDEDRARIEATCAEQDKKVSREIQEIRRRTPASGI